MRLIHLFLIGLVLPSTFENPITNFFEGSGWVDRLPSLEVKFKPDGISVSTGPSREEIYWMIGYIIIAIIVFIVMTVAVGLCIYKCCKRSNGSANGHEIQWYNPCDMHFHRSAVAPQRIVGSMSNSYIHSSIIPKSSNVNYAPCVRNISALPSAPYRSTS